LALYPNPKIGFNDSAKSWISISRFRFIGSTYCKSNTKVQEFISHWL